MEEEKRDMYQVFGFALILIGIMGYLIYYFVM